MNKQDQAKKFFLSMFHGCYTKTIERYSNSIFYVFNPQMVRQKKLCRILGEKVNGVDDRHSICIFEQDLKNMYFYIKYDKVWQVLEEKYGYTYQEVKDLTSGWLNEDFKIGQFTTICRKL